MGWGEPIRGGEFTPVDMTHVPRAIHDATLARLDETVLVLAHIVEHGECASDCHVWRRAEQLATAHISPPRDATQQDGAPYSPDAIGQPAVAPSGANPLSGRGPIGSPLVPEPPFTAAPGQHTTCGLCGGEGVVEGAVNRAGDPYTERCARCAGLGHITKAS